LPVPVWTQAVRERKESPSPGGPEEKSPKLTYDRPALRRFILISSVVLLCLFAPVAIFVQVQIQSGAWEYEQVFFWFRLGGMLCGGLILIMPLFVWVVTGSNAFQHPVVRAMFPLIGMPLGLIVVSGKSAQPEFYEATAQILPVLLLVLAVEFRAFAVRRDAESAPEGEEMYKLSAGVIIVFLMGGEFLSLAATGAKEVPAYLPGVVSGSIATAFLAVLMYSVIGGFTPHKREA
jgi:hypothetical protein